MAFLLSRGAENVTLEVQRWQYFLRRNGFAQAGKIDGDFGLKTETATKFFQVQHNLPASGSLDAATLAVAAHMKYSVVPDNHYDGEAGPGFPPKPTALSSPSNAERNNALGCFHFKQLARAARGDKDGIVILESCDGTVPDWRATNIVTLSIPQPVFAVGFAGTIDCHQFAAPHIAALFAKWEELDLLHLVIAFDGAFSPRYKRDHSPSDAAHGKKSSRDVSDISNHAFGAAFDINADDNPYGKMPALIGTRGCTRELVASANALGFYWGGHFSSGSQDGMHFEFADF